MPNTVSESEFNAYMASINNKSGAELASMIDMGMLAYEGFDGKKVAMQFFFKANEARKDDTGRNTDLSWMLAFAIQYGSITENNKKKMKENARAKYEILRNIYDLKPSGSGLASDILTIPRMKLAFPAASTRLHLTTMAKEFSGPCSSSELPNIMKNNVFPALLPSTLDGKIKLALAYSALAYSVDQGVVIQNPGTVKTESEIKSIAKRQWSFILAALNSSWPPTAVRVRDYKSFKTEIQLGYSSYNKIALMSSGLIGASFNPITEDELASSFS